MWAIEEFTLEVIRSTDKTAPPTFLIENVDFEDSSSASHPMEVFAHSCTQAQSASSPTDESEFSAGFKFPAR